MSLLNREISSSTSAPSRSIDVSSLSIAEILRFDVQFSEISVHDQDFALFDFDSGKVESIDGSLAVGGACKDADIESRKIAELERNGEVKEVLKLKDNRQSFNHVHNVTYLIGIVILGLLIFIPIIFTILKNIV